ncbi:MAG: SCP2 sterol-binding domain-containing protein [Anaerolineae bacterium]|jgi:putative sterol carrier protein
MAVTSVQEVLERVAQVDPSRLEGLTAVVLFDLSGEGGGKWTMTVADNEVQLETGEPASPDVTLSLDAPDLVAISNGEMNPVSAFMQGKVKVSGDMALAMRLQSLLT